MRGASAEGNMSVCLFLSTYIYAGLILDEYVIEGYYKQSVTLF